MKDRNKEALPEAPLVAAIEPLTQAPFAAAPQVDAVAELAATFDAVRLLQERLLPRWLPPAVRA